VITASDPAIRNRALEDFCRGATTHQLMAESVALNRERRTSNNLYNRVRALFFLYAIHRFYLPSRVEVTHRHTLIPFKGYEMVLSRRYEEAISIFLAEQAARGLSEGLASALAAAYRGLAFDTLADQVRHSVRSIRGNQWMFRMGHPADYPLRLRPEML
jgi:hypothetical protein